MTRFLDPRCLVRVGDRLWVLDQVQPVAAVLAASTGQRRLAAGSGAARRAWPGRSRARDRTELAADFSSIRTPAVPIAIPVSLSHPMVRVPLTEAERRPGQRLGELLRTARGAQHDRGRGCRRVCPVTLRKIETGCIPTPALCTVAALTSVLGRSLDAVVAAATTGEQGLPHSAA